MQIFHRNNRDLNADTRRLYATYEIAYTAADFAAGVAFLIGSVLFFWDSLENIAVVFFIVGSVLFVAKPALRLGREVHLYRMGELDHLAGKAED